VPQIPPSIKAQSFRDGQEAIQQAKDPQIDTFSFELLTLTIPNSNYLSILELKQEPSC
jgi:hypothetical protein